MNSATNTTTTHWSWVGMISWFYSYKFTSYLPSSVPTNWWQSFKLDAATDCRHNVWHQNFWVLHFILNIYTSKGVAIYQCDSTVCGTSMYQIWRRHYHKRFWPHTSLEWDSADWRNTVSPLMTSINELAGDECVDIEETDICILTRKLILTFTITVISLHISVLREYLYVAS